MWGSLQLRSPSYPNFYPENIDCYWYYSGLPSDRMNITMVEFNLELGSDYMTLYDGLTLTPPPLLTFSGTYANDTKLSFVSPTKTLLIHFHANGLDANKYKGFNLVFKAT